MYNKKILLLFCGNFNGYLDDGGTASLLTLLRRLADKGADCRIQVVTGPGGDAAMANYYDKVKIWTDNGNITKGKDSLSFILKGIPVNVRFVKYDIFRLYHKADKVEFEDLIKDVQNIIGELRPDVVFSTQENIFALKAASEYDAAHFHIFQSVVYKTHESIFKLYEEEFRASLKNTSVIVFNSFLKRDILKIWNKEAFLMPSPIDLDQYIVGERKPEYITFVNYHPHKGVAILWNIIRKMPDKRFLVVDKLDMFNKEPWMTNVETIRWEPDMRKIYAKTKILVVPSLIPESFCRVIAEAVANGIPVIANKVEGIKDIWKDAAFLVDVNEEDRQKKDYFVNSLYHVRTYEKYIELITALDSDEKMYAEASRRALAESRRIKDEQEKAMESFALLIENSKKNQKETVPV